MKALYIAYNDVFSRHELGFVAAVSELGRVDVVVLSSKVLMHKLRVASDNGEHAVTFYEVPCSGLARFSYYANIVRGVLKAENYDIAFATPRLPVFIARSLRDLLHHIILRLWSIRAAKLRDNLRFGAREDVFIYVPSILANMTYMSNLTYIMTIDNATYSFAKKIYPMFKTRLLKIYPPYGFIREDNNREYPNIPEIIDRGDYVLGFTSLNKKGPYLKFEAKPHATVLYQLARNVDVNVILAGSTLEDWKQAFPNLEPPRNLHIIGRGLGDDIVAKLYDKAKLVVAPITNRNISNRLLEALFYGKPVISTEVVRYVHPELRHGKHVYISSWDNIVEDAIKLLRDDEAIEGLRLGAKEAYTTYFSTMRNVAFVKRLI